MEESKVNFENVLALLNMVDDTSDTVDDDNSDIIESSQSTPRNLRSSASKVVDGGVASIAAFTNMFKQMITNKRDERVERESVPKVINCLVKVLSGMYRTLSNHGKHIKEIFEQLKSEKTDREKLLEQIQKKFEDMERKDRESLENIINEKVEKTEAVLEKKIDEEIEKRNTENKEFIINHIKEQKDNLEELCDRKLKDLETKCDEGRQREMKGTLIISSPERGQIRTEAEHRRRDWEDGSHGVESDLDMVIRMVYEKTGVWIPHCDVSACHRFGKARSHSYVLQIWNRKQYSAWEALSWMMLTGKGYSDKNIFINFMLTARRTELSKQVRMAKKDRKIAKYSIDQNGKIWIKKIGSDNDFYTVSSMEDLENFIAS